jgi:hypothetical protein
MRTAGVDEPPRISIKNHEVCRLPWGNRVSHGETNRFIEGQGLLRVPGLPAVPGSGNRRRNRHPGIQGRNWRIRPKDQLSTAIHQTAKRKSPIRSIGPIDVGHIAVINRVLRLNARNHTELGEASEVIITHQLCMFNASAKTVGRHHLQDESVCLIANRVNGEGEP